MTTPPNRRSRARLLVGLAALASMLFAAHAAHAGTCRGVKLKISNFFKNDRGNTKKIRVRKIIYYNKTDGRWRKDPVHNTVIPYGYEGQLVESLEGSDNEFITKIQVVFQTKTSDGWSDEYWCSNVNKDFNLECNDGRGYKLKVTGTARCKG